MLLCCSAAYNACAQTGNPRVDGFADQPEWLHHSPRRLPPVSPGLAVGRALLYGSRMGLFRRRLILTVEVLSLLAGNGLSVSSAGAQQPSDRRQTLVGTYDGGQTEIAAGLELRADGRFRYGLSYAALDEEAEGRWILREGAVLLTSDPVSPPRFVLVEDHDTPTGGLVVKLDLPQGMSGQYFRAEIRLADGAIADEQLSEEGELRVAGPAFRPVSVTLRLPIAGLSSAVSKLSGAGGHQLRFRFEPHDLGKVAFVGTALRIEADALLLSRHDRTLRFRRLRDSEVPTSTR